MQAARRRVAGRLLLGRALSGCGVRERGLLEHVVSRAEAGCPDSVLEEMSRFWDWHSQGLGSRNWQRRSQTLAAAMREHSPRSVLELGCYCGYTAVRLAALSLHPEPPTGPKLVSVERDPLFAAIATKLIEHAGLAGEASVLIGSLESQIERIVLELQGTGADVVLLEQPSVKGEYLADLERLRESGLVTSGSLVLCDTTVYPGDGGDEQLEGLALYTDYVTSSPEFETRTCEMEHPWGIQLSEEDPPRLLLSTLK